jgi:UDP-N-acetylglucosamine 1-carboxyvinyltransferase
MAALYNNGLNGNPHFLVEGGRPLRGVFKVPGAKNAALPIIAGTILAPGRLTLGRVPDISDVRVMLELLNHMGAEIELDDSGILSIDTTALKSVPAPYSLVKKLNASFDITGALVARFGEAMVPMPGGCVIGTRAVDQHLMGFRLLGCDVRSEPGGFVAVKASGLVGNRIRFAKTSVGATKNVMMAACMARGRTVLENVAREPEVVDLANFLAACGASINGQGSSRIEISGVRGMSGAGVRYNIISDRLVAGTYLLAAAITRGEITATGVEPEHLKAFIRKLRKTGQDLTVGEDFIHLRGVSPILSAGAVIAEPYPAFPTDLQPPMVAYLSLAQGVSYVKEKIFDMRFNYVDDLRRMGANIEVDSNTAVVRGVERLMGAPIDAPDIRAGAALVLAALAAEGTSQVHGLHFIDRGYEKMEERLSALGASIRRVAGDADRH